MSLKINGRNIQSLPLRFRNGAGAFEYAETNKSSLRNIYAGDGVTDKASGNPAGHLYPSAWVWPQKSGSITSFNSINGVATFSGSLALGLNADSSINGTSTLTATGFVTANLDASISGASTVTGAAAITLNGSVTISASGSVSATMVAIGTLSGSVPNSVGTVYGIPFALGRITCEITPFTELSPQTLATAVWSATAADNNDPGTMGELLNGAGGGATPSVIADAVWNALLADYTDPASMGVAVQDIQTELAKRLKTSTFVGLS
jgi:hypothetical protein